MNGLILLEYFDRVYITNMPERTDRKSRMMGELEAIGIKPCVNKVEFVNGVRVSDADGFPSAGYRGCYLCFLGILRRAYELRLKRFLLLEDDVIFHRRAMLRLPGMIADLNRQPWDFAYFGHPIDLGKETGGWHRTDVHFAGGDFVAFSGPLIERLLPFMEQVQIRPSGDALGGRIAPDAAFNLFREFNPDVVTLLANPLLGRQALSPSGLSPSRWFDRMPVVRTGAALLRQALLTARHP